MIGQTMARRAVVCAFVFLALVASSSARTKRSTSSSSDTSRAANAALIVIDAGHGGFDRGGIPRQRVAEKDIALDVALRLKRKLQAGGYKVVMTRDTDVFVPLPSRVAIANSYRNGIFVCIHFNSATRSGANGVETYYYSRDSAKLASDIHKNVIAGAPSENRGIRRRGYYVLRKTAIPGILVECGFLTNPEEARLALTADYRDKLAEEIMRGIAGKPPTRVREPASQSYPAATEMERQPYNAYGAGTDFIRVPPERTSRKASRHKSSKKKKSSKTKKKSTTKSSN